jgi:murein DD-endopeptidase MepM/ murein hydrolase activator NlpD
MEGTSTTPARKIVGGASLDTPERARAYVASVQRDLNLHLRRLDSPSLLAVDGEWDTDTQLAFERVCRILGIDAVRSIRTFRLIAASGAHRTDAEEARAQADGAAFEQQLRAQFAAGANGGGNSGPPAVPHRTRTVVGGRSLLKDKRAHAYVAALQRDLNHHLVMLGSPTVLAVDGEWGRETDLAFRRVCRVLGLEPHRAVRTFRAIGGAAAPLTAAERERAAGDGATYTQELRHHFATAPVPKPPKPPAPPAPPQGDTQLAAALRAAGARYEDAIVRESRRQGVPVSLICAVMEVETGFQNVFGHDKVPNPIKSPDRGLLAVTEERYKQYLKFRHQGLGNQGVGPMQLTSPGLQDRADALGGTWNIDPNIRVGVELLAGNIQRLGLVRGVAAYNGAMSYATDLVLPLEKKWRAKLGSAVQTHSGATGGAGPRTLKVRTPRMTGSDVIALQKLLNKRFAEWKIGVRISEDGEYGPETRTAARRAAHALGLATADVERGITPAVRSKLRRPTRRTAAELERAKQRRPWLRKLRKANATSVGGSGNYPLGVHGPIIGTPYVGTHTRGNWQSDNALDIAVPNGTAVLALADGEIVKTYKSPTGVTAGWQLTLRAADNAWFYGHLTTVTVHAGQRVRKGQTIGTSGSANGVAHLHIGQQVGRPRFQ